MTTLQVIIDTDPGLGEPGSVIDDGLAIALALAAPELDVLGLTIVNGNVGASTGYGLAQALLQRLGRPDVPVHLGAGAPLVQDMARVWEVFGIEAPDASLVTPAAVVGGADANAEDVAEDAVSWLIDQVARRPGEITIAAIGPMTNLALAIGADPEFAGNVREIVVMAGNATGRVEHVDIVADFNVLVDPDAMDIVLRSGARVRMIGIDQTSRVVLDRADAQRVREQDHTGGAASWIADRVDAWIDVLEAAASASGSGSAAGEAAVCLLHDPLVIASLVDPDLCTFVVVDAEVDLGRGDIRVDLPASDGAPSHRPALVEAAVDTDVAAFRTLFFSRLATL